MLLNILAPCYTVESIVKIDLAELSRRGIRGLLLDFDNTLVAWSHKRVNVAVKTWVKKALDAGFKLCIVSNAVSERLKAQAKELGIPFVPKALKPTNIGIKRAIKLLDLKASQVIMVGDQLFTDVLAGNVMGLATILVKPIFLKEQWWMKAVRWLEGHIQKAIGASPVMAAQ